MTEFKYYKTDAHPFLPPKPDEAPTPLEQLPPAVEKPQAPPPEWQGNPFELQVLENRMEHGTPATGATLIKVCGAMSKIEREHLRVNCVIIRERHGKNAVVQFLYQKAFLHAPVLRIERALHATRPPLFGSGLGKKKWK